jgi:hypothetical protein
MPRLSIPGRLKGPTFLPETQKHRPPSHFSPPISSSFPKKGHSLPSQQY